MTKQADVITPQRCKMSCTKTFDYASTFRNGLYTWAALKAKISYMAILENCFCTRLCENFVQYPSITTIAKHQPYINPPTVTFHNEILKTQYQYDTNTIHAQKLENFK